MNAGIIAALLVMTILTIFTFLILRIIAVSAGSKIRDNVINQIQTYETLLQKKTAELEAVNKEIQVKKDVLINKKISEDKLLFEPLQNIFLPSDVNYRVQDFSDDYKNIKENFIFNPDEIIQNILHSEMINPEKGKLYEALLEKLSFDNVFKLFVLKEEEQIEVLEDILTPEEKKLLEQYMDSYHNFNAAEFYQWLYIQSEMSKNQIVIKTSRKHDNLGKLGGTIQTIYDKNLCEGFQVLTGNRLYDYGIRKSELL